MFEWRPSLTFRDGDGVCVSVPVSVSAHLKVPSVAARVQSELLHSFIQPRIKTGHRPAAGALLCAQFSFHLLSSLCGKRLSDSDQGCSTVMNTNSFTRSVTWSSGRRAAGLGP